MTIYLHQHDLPDGIDLGDTIAIDTETRGLNITRDRLCLVQVSAGDGHAHLIQFDGDAFDGKMGNAPNLAKQLGDNNRLKIMQYARFDMAVVKHYLGVDMTPVYCTKIASKLVRTYTDKHGLANLCRELLGVEISKQQQSSDWANSTLSEAQQEYAAADVLYLHDLKAKLDTMLVREDRMALAQQCFEFLPTRAQLDIMGFEATDMFSHI